MYTNKCKTEYDSCHKYGSNAKCIGYIFIAMINIPTKATYRRYLDLQFQRARVYGGSCGQYIKWSSKLKDCILNWSQAERTSKGKSLQALYFLQQGHSFQIIQTKTLMGNQVFKCLWPEIQTIVKG
jgi:hypothetical protein